MEKLEVRVAFNVMGGIVDISIKRDITTFLLIANLLVNFNFFYRILMLWQFIKHKA